jgi:hypothetical protein
VGARVQRIATTLFSNIACRDRIARTGESEDVPRRKVWTRARGSALVRGCEAGCRARSARTIEKHRCRARSIERRVENNQ